MSRAGETPRRPRKEKRARRNSAWTRHRPFVSKSVAVLVALGLVGCGGGAHGPTAVHVGGDAIGQSTVAHWTHVIERGGMLGGSGREDQGTPRERALAFLISSTWLAGEAKRLGLAVSAQAVDRAMMERRAAGGEAEFDEGLRATWQTPADVKLEIRAELALAAIRRSLVKQASLVSEGEIAGFYKSHRRMFVASEARDVDLIESFPSRSAAAALVKRIGGGPRFAKKAFHEEPSRASIARWKAIPEKVAVLRAIFAARLGVLSAPMRLSGSWIVFVVRRKIPARLKPLAEVRGEIMKRLIAHRRRQIVASFNREYKARWSARTSCRPGYVVQGCAQYSGSIAPEENQFSSG